MPTFRPKKTKAAAGKRRQVVLTVSRLTKVFQLDFHANILLALRYAYYVKSRPLVTDEIYDNIERAYFGNKTEIHPKMRLPGSDREADYPPSIRALYMYLALAMHERRKGVS